MAVDHELRAVLGMLQRLKIGTFRGLVGRARDAAIWRRGHVDLLWNHFVQRARHQDKAITDRDHLLAAAEWLERAQDAQPDGGVSGRYWLRSGWSSSYPETTGYIVPTFLALATELQAERLIDRARRAVAFLLRIQLPEGAFPGLEVAENTTEPSVFNTAQVINGLVAWHAATGDHRALDAARRAADWLTSIQDEDGAWRRHFHLDVAATYSAHASCWLAQLGEHTGESRYLEAASRHLDWVLKQQDAETGWFDLSGFDTQEHTARIAHTHTIAYTLWGVLYTSEVLERTDGIESVRRAASQIARRLDLSRWLPGKLDSRWRKQATYACLTGNAQMALIWLRLFVRDGDAGFLNAALKVLDLVKAAQSLHNSDPGIRGGIAGSIPVWGGYIYMAMPNWAAKFFIDALIAKKETLARIASRPRRGWQIPPDVPQSLPEGPDRDPATSLRVVLYTSLSSRKVPQMIKAWSKWNFRPAMVVVESFPLPSLFTRLATRLREGGFGVILSRLLPGKKSGKGQDGSARPGPDYADLVSFCLRERIPLFEVGPLDSPETIEVIRQLQPDVAIHAGAGILRTPVLALPRLGTLNAHMGILPYYRGMNVAEWARFNGDPVGCTVHLIDPGIDTGDILCVRVVNTDGVSSIRELRNRVDEAQIALLGEVLRLTLRTGAFPRRRSQRPEEGRQFFRMHPELAAILEAEMARSGEGRGS